jgi:FtsH-binding integral membrane protein
MLSTRERKEERLYAPVMENEIVSDRTYNMYLGGTVAYGLLMNILICKNLTGFALSIHPLALLLGYFACVIAGSIISSKSQDPLVSFLGYNLVVLPVGLVLSTVIYAYGGLSSYIVLQAFVYTAGITCTMICLSILFPQFFSKIGGYLFSGLIGLILVELVLMLFGVQQNVTAIASAVLFSGYIGYDYWRAQQYPKTINNAVDSALDIYLDIVNLFLRILQILGNSKSSKKNHF